MEEESTIKSCSKCGQKGHVSLQCKNKNNKKNQQQNNNSPTTTKTSQTGDQYYGVVVSLKDTFGFIGVPLRDDEIFFHFDAITKGADPPLSVGEECSFLLKFNNKTGKSFASNVIRVSKGTMLEKIIITDTTLPRKEGEVVQIKQDEEFGVILKDLDDITYRIDQSNSTMKIGTVFSFQVVHHPLHRFLVGLPPFTQILNKKIRLPMCLGYVEKYPSSVEDNGIIKIQDGKEYICPLEQVLGKVPEIRQGDFVWFRPKENDIVTDVMLSIPKEEASHSNNTTTTSSDEEEEELMNWLNEIDALRLVGTVVTLKDNFAFAKGNSNNEMYHIRFNEICASSPIDSTKPILKMNDTISFEPKRSSNKKENDRAQRILILSNKRKQKSDLILLGKNITGTITQHDQQMFVSYIGSSALESKEFWKELLSMNGSLDISSRSKPYHILAGRYCKWLGLKMDQKSIITKEEEENINEQQPSRMMDTLSWRTGGDQQYSNGEEVEFDLYLNKKTGKRVAMQEEQSTLNRRYPIMLNKDEYETGVISQFASTTGSGILMSSYRDTKLRFQLPTSSSLFKPGDMVKYKFQGENEAVDVQPLSNNSSIEIGLKPICKNNNEIRITGIVVKEMTRVSKRDHISSIILKQQTGLSQFSGMILVGRDSLLGEEKEDVESYMSEKQMTTDWRRETELLRTLRSLKVDTKDEEEDPIYVFSNISKLESKVIEKEAKKLGFAFATANLKEETKTAIGKVKKNLMEWSTKIGKRVKVEPYGNGQIVDCRVRNYGTVVQISLFNGLAKLYCNLDKIEVQLLEEENNEKLLEEKKKKNQEEIQLLRKSLIKWVKSPTINIPTKQQIIKVNPENSCEIFMENTPIVTEACILECIPYSSKNNDQILITCDSNFKYSTEEELVSNCHQYGFFLDQQTNVFPIEGDLVEFTPCISIYSGLLRAGNIQIKKRKQDRVVGIVEEISVRNGGYVRPPGKLSAKFDLNDVVGRSVNVGDEVDFKLVGEKAMKVRFLQVSNNNNNNNNNHNNNGIIQSSTTPPLPQQPPQQRPRINQELIAQNVGNVTAATQTASGPDGTIGFTSEKWRNKRNNGEQQKSTKIRPTAPEFVPKSSSMLS